MAEYISGEKHRELQAPGNKSSFSKLLPIIIVAIVLLSLVFYGGAAYQKSHQSKTSAATNSGPGGGFGARSGGQRPNIGQVTAISPSSISVQNSRTGANSTLSITSSTQITDNGQTVSVSDIQTDSTVLVVASSSDSTQAARIMVNPSFGGGAAQTQSPTTTTN